MSLERLMVFVLLVLSIQTLISVIASAHDFGIIGQTFEIAEEPFIEMLKKRLEKVDIEQEKQKIQKRARDQVENPRPVNGIIDATSNRIFYFDPTYIVEKDVVLPCGKILYKAGTRINPLQHMEFGRRLFFIDARKEYQVSWLKEMLDNSLPKEALKEQIEDRVILIGGSVFKVQELLGMEHSDKVYFDQAGEITTKFGIKASPAIAEQEGLMIKIEELNLTK